MFFRNYDNYTCKELVVMALDGDAYGKTADEVQNAIKRRFKKCYSTETVGRVMRILRGSGKLSSYKPQGKNYKRFVISRGGSGGAVGNGCNVPRPI